MDVYVIDTVSFKKWSWDHWPSQHLVPIQLAMYEINHNSNMNLSLICKSLLVI